MLTGVIVVDDRQHEGAAVDHHPLAEQAGAHEGHLLRRAAIEPVHQIDDDRDDDDRDDQPEDQGPISWPDMCFLPSRASRRAVCRLCRRPICLKFRVCSVSATSTGSRSIEEAP